jgi:glycosyltransferase involved in cell wall biosynthesis
MAAMRKSGSAISSQNRAGTKKCSSQNLHDEMRKTMKIAQIAPPWITIPSPNYGDTENVIYSLVEELVCLGHDVTLFAPADAHTSAKQVSFIPKALIKEGVPWQAGLKAYYHLHKSFEYINEHDFDVVHTHLSSSNDMYIFPLAAALTTPHLTTLHSYFPFDRTSNNWVGDADQYFMEWAQHVPLVAISENARRQAAPRANIIGTIHNGLRLQDYPPVNYATNDYYIWMGHFTHEKGAHLAIEAAKRAQVPLILVGTKEPYNRDAMNYYRHLVEPYIDGQQVRYVSPHEPQIKINLLHQAKALLYMAAGGEAFGMEMIEAMAMGCPVISLAHGSAPEIINHSHTGFLVNSTDEIPLYMARLPEIDRQDVRDHVERFFSARMMSENYLEIYTDVITHTPYTPQTNTRVHTLSLGEMNTHGMISA